MADNVQSVELVELVQGAVLSKLAEAIRAQAKAGGVDLVGYSPRQAKKFAGYNARDYQANRVAYLDNLYNSYGRDGFVTTPLGNQIIGQLATENPMLANFYANAYPGAKDAYKRENEVADLMTSHGFDIEKLLAALKYNSQLAAQQGQIARKNYAANSAVDEGRQIRAEGRALDAFRQKVANTIQIAGEYLPPEVQAQLAKLDEDWNTINDIAFGLAGITGNIGDFSDTDEAWNVANITKILQIGAQNN